MKLRSALVFAADPVVRIPVGQSRIWARLSHSLPLYQQAFPDYDQLLPRLVAHVSAQEGSIRIIDIGANVGDTAVACLQTPSVQVLCVEAASAFIELLKLNAEAFPDRIDIAEVFLAAEDGAEHGDFKFSSGTARFDASAPSASIPTMTLTRLLDIWPDYQRSRILKIDTDGYDTKILRGALPYLRAQQPIIFVEFAPSYLAAVDNDYLGIFDDLKGIGFGEVVAFNNTGGYFATGPSGSGGLVAELDRLVRTPAGPPYFDLLMFPDTERLLAVEFMETQAGRAS